MKNNTFLTLLAEYFGSYLPDTKGLSGNTIKSYQYAFKLLFDFLYEEEGIPPEKVTFKVVTEERLLNYFTWLESKRNCSSVTRNLRRTAIASFAKFALNSKFNDAMLFYSNVQNIPKKKTSKTNDIKYFTKEELTIILNMPNTKKNIGKRDAMMLSLLYASGARAQELCDLTLNDIYFGTETNIRLVGKGGKSRLVTIPQNCATMLKNYLNSKNLNSNSSSDRLRYIFFSQTHDHMSISCIEEVVKKYVVKAKLENPTLFKQKSYTPHSFRHSIAVHMLECGESLVVIKAFLGHESISTTTIYTNVTPELANKYLRERGKILDEVTSLSEMENIRTSSLSFLFK